jgi:hypothetical protein
MNPSSAATFAAAVLFPAAGGPTEIQISLVDDYLFHLTKKGFLLSLRSCMETYQREE